MEYDLFTARSATQAQRMSRILRSGGIRAAVQRLPMELARQGCTYAVRVDTVDHDTARQRLQKANLPPERIFRHSGTGYREVTL